MGMIVASLFIIESLVRPNVILDMVAGLDASGHVHRSQRSEYGSEDSKLQGLAALVSADSARVEICP